MKLGLSAATIMGIGVVVLTATSSSARLAVAVPRMGQLSRDCPECPEIVAIPAVGHSLSSPGKPLYATRTEITWHQYLQAVRQGYCPPPDLDDSRPGSQPADFSVFDDENPLSYVAPTTFSCYLRFLKDKTGRIYRIPSAAEWEHLAKGGSTTRWPWGEELGFNHAIVDGWYDRDALLKRFPEKPSDMRVDVSVRHSFPVARLSPNGFGLYDVIGNVAEITTQELPPLPGCVRMSGLARCQVVATRGGSGLDGPQSIYPTPDSTALPWKTRMAPLNGRAFNVGYRLLRD